MIDESKLLFITTAFPTKWLEYSQQLMRKAFPNSKFLVFDGSKNWPYAWFYWLNDLINHSDFEYFIHFDEDFFLTSKDELINLIEKMKEEDITISAPSDGYNHYRSANPVAINSFFMVGNVQKFNSINLNLDTLRFSYDQVKGWVNNHNMSFKDEYKKDFNYEHKVMGGENYLFEQEPYYYVLWKLKENNLKFKYLYPHFDESFKSTNPRIDENSKDIGIHMWYTRQYTSDMDVHGLPNSYRYKLIEEYLKAI